MAMSSYSVIIHQLGIVVDTSILTYLAKGSVSYVYYADRLCLLPLGVFGVAITTVLSPALAQSFVDNHMAVFRERMNWAIMCAGLLGIPCAVGLYVLAQPIVIALFAYRAFTYAHVVQTAAALQVMALGIPAFMWVKVLTTAFYARQDTLTPSVATKSGNKPSAPSRACGLRRKTAS